MSDERDILDRLDEALAIARSLGASDVEVSHAARVLGLARFANSGLTQAGVAIERTTRIRCALGGRIGAATTSGLDDEAFRDAAGQALEAARQSPPLHGFQGFSGAKAAPAKAPFDEATATLGPGERAETLARMFRTASLDGLILAGAYQTGPRTRAVVTSGGARLAEEATEAQLSVIAMDGRASGHAIAMSSQARRIDADALVAEACAGAIRARLPVDLTPGGYDVVLSATAVAELLEWLGMGSFSARAVLDGTSLLKDGPLCDERISIVDDCGYDHPDLVASGFDSEGTVRSRVAFVDRGQSGHPVSDLATAARLGAPSTGHAPPLTALIPEGPEPAAMVMLPGTESVAELVGRVDRGLYVTRFHYVNGLLDTRRAVMTGMTRDGLFEIESGKIGRAVKNLRFTESILEAFGRIGGVGAELRAIPGNWTSSPTLCPALLLRDFHFTGQSR